MYRIYWPYWHVIANDACNLAIRMASNGYFDILVMSFYGSQIHVKCFFKLWLSYEMYQGKVINMYACDDMPC